jgi:predicted AAA+ superfamily ATPase
LGVKGYGSKKKSKESEKGPSVPVGYETIVEMYPLDFEEFLWANGISDDIVALLKNALETETPVSAAIHKRMSDLLLQYAVVGGMPEAVNVFLATHDIGRVIKVQRGIIDEYKDDMIKYADEEDQSRIRECFESIPKQLSKENKKFQYSVVSKGGRASKYLGSLQWIEDAGIIKRCYNLSTPELPLDGNAINDVFKVYMRDNGLFLAMLEFGVQADVLQGNLLGYKGAIFENLVADILGKMGRPLYYFQKGESLELDFLIRYKGKCCPLECKATNGNAKSLKTVLKHPEHYHVDCALKVGNYNVGRVGPLLTLPLYMTFLLTEV